MSALPSGGGVGLGDLPGDRVDAGAGVPLQGGDGGVAGAGPEHRGEGAAPRGQPRVRPAPPAMTERHDRDGDGRGHNRRFRPQGSGQSPSPPAGDRRPATARQNLRDPPTRPPGRGPSSRRCSVTTTGQPPAWSLKPMEPGAGTPPATTHGDTRHGLNEEYATPQHASRPVPRPEVRKTWQPRVRAEARKPAAETTGITIAAKAVWGSRPGRTAPTTAATGSPPAPAGRIRGASPRGAGSR